ncbi:hypothetical protein VE04_06969, partial [Pseudogymnoascus sp. 24MN13]
MSGPNPFERLARPVSITVADQAALEITPGLPNENLRKRNPFHPKEQSGNANHDQHGDGTDGAPLNPTAAGDGSLRSFEQLPTFGDTPRPLNSRDVCAFIVNKMVGTGIYTTPPVVLLLTRSKGEALGLWFIGFVYTLISMTIYLEYARKLPHTGGELIYLDETLPRPRLFAYTLYTFYFVLLYNTATNSMQFAKQVLVCAAGDTLEPTLDPRALRFIAMVALSFFVLLHYFSGRAGRDLNQILAFIKITLLVIVFFAGIARASDHYAADWGIPPNKDSSSSAIAFLYIMFSFTGWENATFVGGEIADHKILKKGFIWAVCIVGVLYILINFIFLLAVPAEFPTTQMAPLFFGGGYHARITWAILVAISASGSLLSVTYTCARVKQVIGMSNIIPWSRLWSSNSPPRQDDNGNFINSPTPQGGLLLHWIFSIILISASSAFTNLNEAISFPGNLQAYAAGWVRIFISIGFPFLFLDSKSRILKLLHLNARKIPKPSDDRWPHTELGHPEQSKLLRKLFWPLAVIYICFNGYIVVVPLIPPYTNGNGKDLDIKGWYYVAVVACISTAAITYYLVAFGRAPNRSGGTHAELLAQPVGAEGSRGYSIMTYAGVHPELFEEDEHNQQYGYRRQVEVVIDDS